MRFSSFSTVVALSATASEVYALPSIVRRGRGNGEESTVDPKLIDPANLPVCIVGAGPAGLTAAHRLQQKGLKSVIFDKKATVGGKCQSYYDEVGQYHPLGALLYSNASYPETLKVIDQTDVIAEEIWPKRAEGHRWQYDHETGKVTQSMPLNKITDLILDAEVWRYRGVWDREFGPYYGIGFKNGIPKSLTVPTKTWLKSHGFVALHWAFIAGMVLYGYGDYEQIPVAYMLQYFTPDIMEFFSSSHPGYLIDYHKVWEQFAERQIHQQIHLGATITKIDRPFYEGKSGNPSITYKIGGKGPVQKQDCAAVVLAFPPTIKNLQAANLELSPLEKQLFKDVITENYYSGAVKVKFPSDYTFTQVSNWFKSPPAAGEVVLAIKLWEDNDIATIYSWDDLYNPKMKSFDEAYQKTKESMSMINKDPANPDEEPQPITDADIRAFHAWDYFPRVMTPGLVDGFYKEFNDIQGQRRTYFASGLNGFETVEFAIRAGADIVESYYVPWLAKQQPSRSSGASSTGDDEAFFSASEEDDVPSLRDSDFLSMDEGDLESDPNQVD